MQLRLSPEAKNDVYRMHEIGSLNFGVRHADVYADDLVGTFAEIEQFPQATRERVEVEPPIRLWPYRAQYLLPHPG